MILKKIKKLLLLIPVFCLFITVSSAETGSGRITGTLLLESGAPMSGGKVFFFNKDIGPEPAPDKYFRIPDGRTIISEGGEFSIQLPEGTYYIGAVMRVSTVDYTPPGDGDFYYISADEKGRLKTYTVSSGETVDLGVVSGAAPLTRVNSEQITGIEGVVIDSNGNLLKELVVLADDRTNGATYMSDMTGSDGSFTVRVPQGGEYTISLMKVRADGDGVSGLVEGHKNGVVSVESESLSGVVVRVILE